MSKPKPALKPPPGNPFGIPIGDVDMRQMAADLLLKPDPVVQDTSNAEDLLPPVFAQIPDPPIHQIGNAPRPKPPPLSELEESKENDRHRDGIG